MTRSATATRRKPMVVSRASFRRIVTQDDDADVSYLDEIDHADTRAALNRGEMSFVGVRARIDLEIPGPPGSGHTIAHAVTSPGLWAIVSDGSVDSDNYLGEVFDDECDTLAAMLTAMGIKVIS